MSGNKQYDLSDFLINGAVESYYDYAGLPTMEKLPTKCECGTTITLGLNDIEMLHSDWCPVYKEYKAKENIK